MLLCKNGSSQPEYKFAPIMRFLNIFPVLPLPFRVSLSDKKRHWEETE
jgi:hypothetical protein